jgi:hypothetical protein
VFFGKLNQSCWKVLMLSVQPWLAAMLLQVLPLHAHSHKPFEQPLAEQVVVVWLPQQVQDSCP